MVKLMKVLLGSVLISLVLPFPLSAHAQSYITPFCDIVIDVGHGGVDGGTSSNGILEKDLNLAIGTKLFNELNKKSFHVGITRIDDHSLSDDSPFPKLSRHLRDLKQRKIIADGLQPKIFLSLHVNWSKNERLRGPVIIYQVNEESYHLAQVVQEHLNEYYEIKKYPQKGKPYFLMKHLDMPSIIVELGYISNAEDFQIMTQEDSQDQLVAAIVRAIEEYLLLYPTEAESELVH